MLHTGRITPGRNDILTRWSLGGGSWYWRGPQEGTRGRPGRDFALDYGIPPGERRPGREMYPRDIGWRAGGDYSHRRDRSTTNDNHRQLLQPEELAPLPSFNEADHRLPQRDIDEGPAAYGFSAAQHDQHGRHESDSIITVNEPLGAVGPVSAPPVAPLSSAVSSYTPGEEDLDAVRGRLAEMQRELLQQKASQATEANVNKPRPDVEECKTPSGESEDPCGEQKLTSMPPDGELAQLRAANLSLKKQNTELVTLVAQYERALATVVPALRNLDSPPQAETSQKDAEEIESNKNLIASLKEQICTLEDQLGKAEARVELATTEGTRRVERAVAAAEEAGEQLRLADGRASTLQARCTSLEEQVARLDAELSIEPGRTAAEREAGQLRAALEKAAIEKDAAQRRADAAVAEAEALREQGYGAGANAVLKQQVKVLKAHLEEATAAIAVAEQRDHQHQQEAAASARQAELAEQEVGRLRDALFGLTAGRAIPSPAELNSTQRSVRAPGAPSFGASSSITTAEPTIYDVLPQSGEEHMRASASYATRAVVSLDRSKHAEKRESTVERRSAAAAELEASTLKAQLQEANATNHQIKQSMYLMNRVLRL